MAKLEAGQRAYEAWCGSHGREPAWRLLHTLDQMAWEAAEQACAVPAASDESQSSWTLWGESTPELGAYYWLRFSDCTARRPAQYRNDKYSGPGFFYEEGREHGGIVAFVRARPPAWSVERRAVPAATQNDNATETSEQWRRAVLAWQEWATALCVHPDGGLLGDGTMRDQLRERLAEAGKAQAESTWSALARWCATDAKEKRIGMNEYADGRWKVWAEWNDDAVTVGSGASADAASADLVACLNKMGGAYVIPPPPSAPEGQ